MENFDPNTNESTYLQLILDEQDGNISVNDAQKLSDWRKLTTENEELYQLFLSYFTNLDLLDTYRKLDTESSLSVLHSKMGLSDFPPVKKTKILSLKVSRWAAAAAILVVGLMITIYFSAPRMVTLTSNNNEAIHFTLPDGSKITLNAGSKITYYSADFNHSRKLELVKGECFLEVVHNGKYPFSIEHHNIVVKDIGTSFNIGSTDGHLTVSVNEGEVSINKNDANFVMVNLKAGELANYNFSQDKIAKGIIQDPNYKAYADHHLIFNNATLAEVAKSLALAYHQKVVIEDSLLKNRRFTAEFKKKSLNNIITVVCKALQLEQTTKGQTIYLKKK
ncbi:MAG: FecR family protein [Pedobacter sp.]|uniref:FecR family protein n=1 Tax=Pedobacter suwonensis TaxID=332999 RepID=UPI00199634C1|nr:FecR family protein [Pedobacter sp.]